MLALYRCDRQADALQAYQDARAKLVDELGIEPGERLRELERAILAQDPGARRAGGRTAAAPRRRRPTRRPARAALVSSSSPVVGSRDLAERLDAETLHAVLDAPARRVDRAPRRQVEGSIGDALVGVFGQTEVHEDDALRAVRAALELRDASAEARLG